MLPGDGYGRWSVAGCSDSQSVFPNAIERLMPRVPSQLTNGKPRSVRPSGAPVQDRVVRTVGEVREWLDEEGWGVIDPPNTPQGCCAHHIGVATAGYRPLTPGHSADWEVADQDGVSYRAEPCRGGTHLSH